MKTAYEMKCLTSKSLKAIKEAERTSAITYAELKLSDSIEEAAKRGERQLSLLRSFPINWECVAEHLVKFGYQCQTSENLFIITW